MVDEVLFTEIRRLNERAKRILLKKDAKEQGAVQLQIWLRYDAPSPVVPPPSCVIDSLPTALVISLSQVMAEVQAPDCICVTKETISIGWIWFWSKKDDLRCDRICYLWSITWWCCQRWGRRLERKKRSFIIRRLIWSLLFKLIETIEYWCGEFGYLQLVLGTALRLPG